MSEYQLAQAWDTVNLHRAGGAAKIELNRPDTLNAWNRQKGSARTHDGSSEVSRARRVVRGRLSGWERPERQAAGD